MQLLGILIELRGEGAAIAGIYRHTWCSRASSIFVLHAPYKVTRPYEPRSSGQHLSVIGVYWGSGSVPISLGADLWKIDQECLHVYVQDLFLGPKFQEIFLTF